MEDFHHLMEELGKLLDISLIPDKHNACVLTFNEELRVQIEPDAADHSLLLAAHIGEIPAGKFRESVLATGLKYNTLCPRAGSFAYFAKNNELVFYRSLLLEGLRADAIEAALNPLVSLAEQWKMHLARGSIPTLALPDEVKKPSVFNLGTV